jgi:hypothetical protein
VRSDGDHKWDGSKGYESRNHEGTVLAYTSGDWKKT